VKTRFFSSLSTAFLCALFTVSLHVSTYSLAADTEITLIPDFDQIGGQVETVQVYSDSKGDRTMFGIYDTGASVISISADD